MNTTAVLVAVLVVGYGGVGASVTDNAAPFSNGEPTVGSVAGPAHTDSESSGSSTTEVEALVNVTFEWEEKPSEVGSEGDLRVTVRASRSISGETLRISVPPGLELVEGEREYDLTLEADESFTTIVRVGVTESGVHRLHVYSSNLLPAEGDESVLRASGVATVITPEAREELESPEESSTATEPPSDESAGATSVSGATLSSVRMGGVAVSEADVMVDGDTAAGTQTVTVDGHFDFNDPRDGVQGAWGAEVQIWSRTAGFDKRLKTVHVDRNGNFETTVETGGGNALYLKVYARNETVATVEDSSDTVHYWRWPSSGTVTTSSGGTWSPSFRATSGEEWLHILRNAMEGWTYIEQRTLTEVKHETFEWGPGAHGSHHHHGGEVHMSGSDGWDDDVILHEYGHHVMNSEYGYVPGKGGSHSMWTATNLGLAWVEGWPTYLEAVVQGQPDYVDRNGATTVVSWNVESGAQCQGITCEGAVARALWDITDGNEDSRTGTPHDVQIQLDDLQDRSFETVWDASMDIEQTERIGNGGFHVDTINEFRENYYEDHSDDDVMVELFALAYLPYNSSVQYNGDPTAEFRVTSADPNVGEPVFFDGSYSDDPEFAIQWPGEWDFDNDGVVDSDSGNNRFGSYNYSTHGEYTVELTIKDNVGATDSTTRTVEVAPAPVCDTCDVPTDPDGDGDYEDLNGDGKVTMEDVYLMYQEQFGLDTIPIDLNGDGEFDSGDLYYLYYWRLDNLGELFED